MMSFQVSQPVALPKGWTRYVRSALLQAISLAATAWILARSRAVTSRHERERLQAGLDRAQTEGSSPRFLDSLLRCTRKRYGGQDEAQAVQSRA